MTNFPYDVQMTAMFVFITLFLVMKIIFITRYSVMKTNIAVICISYGKLCMKYLIIRFMADV